MSGTTEQVYVCEECRTPWSQGQQQCQTCGNRTWERIRGMTIEEFIEARIADDETIARGAIDPNRPGANWHWVTTHDDTPVPDGEEAQPVDDGHYLSLRTLEEFPLSWDPPSTLPAFIVGTDDGFPGGLRHIGRHDPARVLRQCAALRATVDALRAFSGSWATNELELGQHERDGYVAMQLRPIAAIWSDHPDYQHEWKVTR